MHVDEFQIDGGGTEAVITGNKGSDQIGVKISFEGVGVTALP